MSKLKLDSRSLTDAMQKNPDFIPTLVNALSGGNVTDANEQLSVANPQDSGMQLADDTVDSKLSNESLEVDEVSLAPSDLRSAVEEQRMLDMMDNALS